MKPEDFYNLRIGQVIWYKGEKKEITVLSKNFNKLFIYFDSDTSSFIWDLIRSDCSLEASKKKEIYWQWVYRDHINKEIMTTTFFYNEDGYSLQGTYFGSIWHETPKKKIESIFWEE